MFHGCSLHKADQEESSDSLSLSSVNLTHSDTALCQLLETGRQTIPIFALKKLITHWENETLKFKKPNKQENKEECGNAGHHEKPLEFRTDGWILESTGPWRKKRSWVVGRKEGMDARATVKEKPMGPGKPQGWGRR